MAINLQAISRNTTLAPPRIMVYGPHGLGKTTFGASSPNPIFILTEDGLGRLEADHFPLATKFSDVQESLKALQGEHDFQTVVIDSLDWLDNLIWEQINTQYEAKDLAYGKGAVIAADLWRKILDDLTALRNKAWRPSCWRTARSSGLTRQRSSLMKDTSPNCKPAAAPWCRNGAM